MVSIRMPDGTIACKGEGELERLLKVLVTHGHFSKIPTEQRGEQWFISNDDYKLPGPDLTLFFWKGSQIIFK